MQNNFVKNKACVVGFPISHSLSPKIHNFWINKYDLNAEYNKHEVKPDELKEFFNWLPKAGYAGCNLTIPLKEKALEILGNIDPFAKFIGAVNTVIINENKEFLGTNTDFIGFIRAIETAYPEFNFADGRAIVLGAGGASRAICFALASMKAPEITIINRNKERAEKIATDLALNFGYNNAIAKNWEEIDLSNANLLVNSTSLGMIGCPELKIDLKDLPKNALVNDIVYKPLETQLLKNAKQRGNKVIDGLGMLMHQAAPAFNSFFGVKPSVDAELKNYILEKN